MTTPKKTLGQKKYDLTSSPLYKLSNKKKLAALLGIDPSALVSLRKSGLCGQYNIFVERTSRRFITEPKGELLLIHKRLLKFFCRITPPDYIHSAVKKRSYKTNAEQHIAAENLLKIDIKKFFPSVKFHCIHDFFLNILKCSKDIATILAQLCTVETEKHGVHLPTGSCISPVLSFLVNQRLFDSVREICDKNGCKFTVYVDDITVSGKLATRALLTRIAVEIKKRGYDYHKIHTYHGVAAKVTGLMVFNNKLTLPHDRAKKIRELTRTLACATGSLRPKLLASLIGRLSEAEQFNPSYRIQRLKIMQRYNAEWKDIIATRMKRPLSTKKKKQAVVKESLILIQNPGLPE